MPIIRRDDTTGPIDQSIILIWKNRWLLAAVAIATAILVYLALLFVDSTFRVKAEVFVNQLPNLENGETPSPETVVSILKSQSVLKLVRDDFARKFDMEKLPKIEKFAKQFEVESDILQDTTVRKEISPVLILQVEAKGADETRYIMESWIRNSIQQFGNYTAQEAVIKRASLMAEKAEIEKQIAAMAQRRAESEARLPFLRKILAEKLDLLSPSLLRMQDQQRTDRIDLELTFNSPRLNAGLLERHANLLIEMRSGTAPTTAAAALSAINTAIDDAKTSIAEAQTALAVELAELSNAHHQWDLLVQNQAALNEALSRFIVSAATYKEINLEGLPAGGDLRALSMPVTPEARIWPKRTTTAAIAAVAAAIIAIFIILGRNFLSRLLATTQ